MDWKHATIQPQSYKTPLFSVPSPSSAPISGETIPRRHPLCIPDLKFRPSLEIATVYDIFLRSAANFASLNAVGTRKLLKLHNEVKIIKKVVNGKETEVKKNWEFFELGPYEWETYGEYKKRALQIGCGFRKLGLVEGEKVHLFAGTSANWLVSAHAAISQSLPIVTSYATLGSEGLTHSLLQTCAKVIFVDPSLLTSLIEPLKKAKDLQFVIWNSGLEVKQSDIDVLQVVHEHLVILSLEDLRKLGEKHLVDPVPPKAEDICCYMYTSGSTGPPKGVPLSHKNIVAAVTGIDNTVGQYLSPSDSVLTYLPLAHSFEFAFENACFYWGIPMGYGSPRTLSNLSMRHCKGDIAEFRPSILIGVPAIWETIRKGIESRIEKETLLTRSVFWGAMSLKAFLCDWSLPGPGLIDALVFNQVRKETGGQLRACFNGAGPVGRDTRRFISFVIAPLISGYGLTETTAMGTLQDPLEWTDNTLGSPTGCVEIKLIDAPEFGYFTDYSPPRGEILIRGDAVMSGYYMNEKETRESFTSDGWFRTGDIGEWAPNGHLKVIDRVKNLVKGRGGEYIALEKLESIYRESNLVANICVYATSESARPVAIILPSKFMFRNLAENNAIKSKGSLIHDFRMRDLVLIELQSMGKRAGLAGFEILDGLILTDFEWTVQNGLLTPAQKLNRRKIVAHYQAELDTILGEGKKATKSHL